MFQGLSKAYQGDPGGSRRVLRDFKELQELSGYFRGVPGMFQGSSRDSFRFQRRSMANSNYLGPI